ncbi:MAG: helix-turn-helix domain-containing protein, partial [Treponema sp.]|nr:helix-turn-helix domain-containing protein [Treponema sp.]
NKGVHPARQVRRARILLLLDEGEGEPVKVPEQSEIARQCQCNIVVVYTVSRQYVNRVVGEKRCSPDNPMKKPEVYHQCHHYPMHTRGFSGFPGV